MSYPSIAQVISNSEIDLKNACQDEVDKIFWEAFQKDLTLGVDWLINFCSKIPNGVQSEISWHDPNLELGKQLVRLLGCDLSRAVCERKLNVAFGLYNCCGVTGKKGGDDKEPPKPPQMSYKIQAERQLTPDC